MSTEQAGSTIESLRRDRGRQVGELGGRFELLPSDGWKCAVRRAR